MNGNEGWLGMKFVKVGEKGGDGVVATWIFARGEEDF